MATNGTHEDDFLRAWHRGPLGDAEPEREYRFYSERKWAFDFAFPDQLVAVEIEGRGRHQTVTGFRGDCDKYNKAASLGWSVYRFPATDMRMKNMWGESVLDLFVELVCEKLVRWET